MKAKPAAAPRPSRARARARARSTSIAAFVVLAALVPTTASASGTQEVEAELPYVCALPSGQLPATVRVAAEFPARAEVGEAFTPSGVTTTVELPEEAVADLAGRGAAEVRAATRLDVGVAQNAATARASWRGGAEPVALPESGPLTLVTRGDVPSVAGRGDGDLTFSAGSLAIDLTLAADGTAPGTATADSGSVSDSSSGSDSGSGSLTVDCTLAEDAPGQGLLATVPVGTGTGAPSGSASPSGPAGTSGAPDDGQPDGRGDRQPERQSERSPKVLENTPGTAPDRDDVPPCRYDEQHPPTDVSLNAYVTGYANVKKLKGAAYLPPSCVLIEQGVPVPGPPDPDYLIFDTVSYANFHYQERRQTPPFEATFLSFDFAPVKATMVLEQTDTMRIDSRMKMSMTDFSTTTDTYVRAPLVLHVLDLELNGTPLDVGSECRTETSLVSEDPDPANFPGDHLVLYGRGELLIGQPATGYLLLSGGVLAGEATIPAFTGCGTDGEDLDRLLTASVSGPGNLIKQVQGQTCAIAAPVFPSPTNEGQCTEDLQPYEIPVAEH
ncbi:DUF6801 domain-containing protein [Streptomyces sp. NPDC057362]|uniref:DUF6801 domain-containing protein n=1 Tax=Streptomyces sp. NPDC057362 TaxID=3346106 RepID=UPI003644D41B